MGVERGTGRLEAKDEMGSFFGRLRTCYCYTYTHLVLAMQLA
jgi:hypothetical protein